MVVQTPLYRLCVYRSFAKIVEVYEVVESIVDVPLLLVELAGDYGIILADCDALWYFVRMCPHTWPHWPDVNDGVVSAPTKAQQRETLPRHRGGGRRARTPVGWIDNEMKIS